MRGKTFTFFLFLLSAVLSSQAQFNCTTNDVGVSVTGYTGPGGAVTVPDTINYLPVTCIADEAFYGRSDITSLDIPDTVTSLGNYTFYNCASLSSVTLPIDLLSVGNYSFEGCSSLTNVELPSSVTSLGTAAFGDCSRLASVTLPGNLTNIGYTEFINCSSLTNIVIPGGVTSIGEYAFSGCTRLRGVNLPNGVTNISYGAFFNCSSLASINIPNSVSSIGQYAFYICTNLAAVHFNGGMPSGDTTIFSGDSATAYYTPGAAGWGSSFGGIQAAYWTLPYPVILSNDRMFGVQNGQWGFTVAWATNVPAVVQASTDLATWQPVETNTTVNGSFYFSDPYASGFPNRFYRVMPAGQ